MWVEPVKSCATRSRAEIVRKRNKKEEGEVGEVTDNEHCSEDEKEGEVTVHEYPLVRWNIESVKSEEMAEKKEETSQIDDQVCRVCFSSAEHEPLYAPCHCKGSIGLIHKSCLERWLKVRSTRTCNVCGFEFKVVKKNMPLRMFFAETEHREHLILMAIHLICLVGDVMVLTFGWLFGTEFIHGRSWFIHVLVLSALLLQSSFWAIVAFARFGVCVEPIVRWRRRTGAIQVVINADDGPPPVVSQAPASPSQQDNVTRIGPRASSEGVSRQETKEEDKEARQVPSGGATSAVVHKIRRSASSSF
ncbi:E3 ubiquitin-protein ligase MARCHF2-like [Ornithodoros turicata]|uniref:E3 ubiquitin-protein ligase MARCHF2-like n=1 Tax=Ornithodoros turicata TaxID=34597 RepID=UPI00313905A1